ncbi:MAG: dienelactone hydrolase family protein [Gammaproteobacteria bacterium]
MNRRYRLARALLAGMLLGLSLETAAGAETYAGPPAVAIHSEKVQYALVQGQSVYGYLSKPTQAQGAQPGVILIHMWWGLNQHMRDVADRLARQGYVVLAVDLYNGRSTRDPRVAAQLMDIASANTSALLSNLEQAVSYMSLQQHVNHLGVIGWSVGGHWAFQIASDLPQAFDALAVFYTAPYTEPSQLTTLRMPILAFFGERDPFVPQAVVDKFQWAAELASAQVTIHVYPDALPTFDDPDSTAYNSRDAQDAWQQLDAFLLLNLKGSKLTAASG